MPQHTSASRLAAALAGVGLLAALSGCNTSPAARTASVRGDLPAVSDQPVHTPLPALRAGRLRADVLVTAPTPLTAKEIRAVKALAPTAVVFVSGRVRVADTALRVASVDPGNFRRFTAAGTAESQATWQVIAGGGLIASHAVAQKLRLALGQDVTLIAKSRVPLRLGALATTGIPGTDLIVDTATGRRLGLHGPTSVLLNAGRKDPAALASSVRRVTGKAAEVDLLTAPAASPVAFLTGSKAAKAFGAFSYKYFPDGTIQPDARWVRANIVYATVPILGRVTCHRLMVPQLRGALTDVVRAGLASSLHTYNGCYVPRFIERDPSHAISLHTWGIAIDMDSASNYRGIKGTMDPRVVAIFKRWGFRWGGDWSYTDPMHFEIGALLTTPRR